METFFDLVSTEFRWINQMSDKLTTNLSTDKRLSLKSLKNNKDIVIRNADKGDAVVIQDLDQYILEANNILMDSRYYNTVTTYPSEMFKSEFNQLINYAYVNNIISKKEKAFLIPTNPIVPY